MESLLQMSLSMDDNVEIKQNVARVFSMLMCQRYIFRGWEPLKLWNSNEIRQTIFFLSNFYHLFYLNRRSSSTII